MYLYGRVSVLSAPLRLFLGLISVSLLMMSFHIYHHSLVRDMHKMSLDAYHRRRTLDATVRDARGSFYHNESGCEFVDERDEVSLRYIEAEQDDVMKEVEQCVDETLSDEPMVQVSDVTRGDISRRPVVVQQVAEHKLRVDDTDSELYSLKLNSRLVDKIFNSKKFRCYTQRFDRILNKAEDLDNIVMLGEMREFLTLYDFEVIIDTPGFYSVHCMKHRWIVLWQTVYRNIVTVLPRNMDKLKVLRDKFNGSPSNKRPSTPNKHQKQHNVLILSFDSVSGNHFKRTFPITFDTMQRIGPSTVFNGYRTVGENTYPNMIPFWSGLLVERHAELHNDATTPFIDQFTQVDDTFHDTVPTLWNLYERAGYLTLYQEEIAKWGTFNNGMNGFRRQPTHFYGHPFWLKYDELMTGPRHCVASHPTYETSISQVRGLIARLTARNATKSPFFSFNFISYYTHDNLAVPKQFDVQLAALIADIKQSGLLNDTMLVVMSDHGSRISHYYRDTEQGQIERSMPFLSIHLPPLLWQTTYARNLANNAESLLTTFDLHQTLKHFLNLQTSEMKYEDVGSDLGTSLLMHIPSNRTCVQAHIANVYCNCRQQETLTEESLTRDNPHLSFTTVAEVCEDHVNAQTSQVRDQCAVMRVEAVLSARRVTYPEENQPRVFYVFKVRMQPGDAVFEATLTASATNERQLEVFGDMVRMSRYGEQSQCMRATHPRLLTFCFCTT